MKLTTIVTIFGFLENHAGAATRYYLFSVYLIQLDKLGLNLGLCFSTLDLNFKADPYVLMIVEV